MQCLRTGKNLSVIDGSNMGLRMHPRVNSRDHLFWPWMAGVWGCVYSICMTEWPWFQRLANHWVIIPSNHCLPSGLSEPEPHDLCTTVSSCSRIQPLMLVPLYYQNVSDTCNCMHGEGAYITMQVNAGIFTVCSIIIATVPVIIFLLLNCHVSDVFLSENIRVRPWSNGNILLQWSQWT